MLHIHKVGGLKINKFLFKKNSTTTALFDLFENTPETWEHFIGNFYKISAACVSEMVGPILVKPTAKIFE